VERKNLQPTLTDGMTADLGGPKAMAFFAACDRMIPWQQLAEAIKDLFVQDDSQGGRPHCWWFISSA
jgi:hypothetical protein